MVAQAFHGKPDVKNICVNHKDGNQLNNHAKNLEYITIRENINHFRRLDGKRYIGARKTESGKYSAQINVDGVLKYLGTFNTEKEAAEVYAMEAERLGQSKYLTRQRIK